MPPYIKERRRSEGVLKNPKSGLKAVVGGSRTQTTKVDVRMSTEKLSESVNSD